MSQKSRRWDEFTVMQLLSQKWASQNPKLRDYACNSFAMKLVIIDIALDKLSDDNPLKAKLKEVREALKLQGEAMYISVSDTLTNLGLKVGKTYKTIDLSKE